MNEFPLTSKILNMTLKNPEAAHVLSKPQVKSIICELELTRATAEEMFKSLVFDEGEDTVIVTEVLRPAKLGEPSVFFHSGCGVGFCVDHYELNGVPL